MIRGYICGYVKPLFGTLQANDSLLNLFLICNNITVLLFIILYLIPFRDFSEYRTLAVYCATHRICMYASPASVGSWHWLNQHLKQDGSFPARWLFTDDLVMMLNAEVVSNCESRS